MSSSDRITRQSSHGRLLRLWPAVVILVVSSVAMFSPPAASAAPLGYKIDLKVLVLDDDTPSVDAMQAQMQVEGVPFTTVTLASPTRPMITDAYLSSGDEAFYQAVVAPSYALTGLSVSEVTALRGYEAKFGIREADMFSYPGWDFGLGTPVIVDDFTGVTATVNATGQAAGWGYLNGPVPFSIGSAGYLAQPVPGGKYTSVLDATVGSTGSVMGIYADLGREHLIVSATLAFTFPQFKYLGHGIITWMTRGVHFGYNRNNLTFHIDDAFATDNLWDPALNCTPAEDCLLGTDPPGARMSPDDVTYAVNWMQANGYTLTLAFNGLSADNTSIPPDPLTAALVANKAKFNWLNHGLAHIYQGCVQNLVAVPWVCDVTSGWTTQVAIYNEIQDNINKARAGNQKLGLSFNATEYLSGEHSGLKFTNPAVPEQNQIDNPNFIAALVQAGIRVVGSDASREPTARVIGSGSTSVTTIPRHPTALYYNTATRAQAIDEYNSFYAPEPDGKCTSNCITALTLDSQFDSYIVPTDAAFDLGFILSNDPRPFYAHSTNLIGGVSALAYPLLSSILGTYRNVFAASAPLKNLNLTDAASGLVRQQKWDSYDSNVPPHIVGDVNSVTGYVQNGVVNISKSASPAVPVAVPFTAPTGTVINGNPNNLESYGGEVSGWLTAATSFAGTLPAPSLVTTGGTFLRGQVSTMTFAVASAPTATVAVMSSTPALPAGLTYTQIPGGATITGTPATSGVYTLSVGVVTAGYNNLETVNLYVARVAAFSSAATATAVAGNPFTFTVTTTNGIPNPAITIKSGSLPSGITLTDLGTGSATLSGTPALATGGQSFPIILTATTPAGATDQSFTLVVNSAPQFTSTTSATAVVGAPFSFTVTTAGSPAAVITRAGNLPTGITFTAGANGTATLSGTASAGLNATFPITFTATNSAGVTTQAFTLTVSLVASLPAEPVSPDHVALTPARLADTRPGGLTVDGLFAGGGIRGVGSTLELVVAGRGGVATDAAAVALNVTVAEPTGSGFVTVYPCGATQPNASNVNFTAGEVGPNAAIAKIGVDGKVCLFVSNNTNLIVDVTAYFPATSSLHSINPARVLDTRAGYTTVDGLQQSEGVRTSGSITEVQITGRATVPSDATAVVLNVTVTEAKGPGFVTGYPCGTAIPTASNLNYGTGSTVANLVIAKIGTDGKVCIYTSEGTHLVADVNGYFPAATSYRALDPARLLDTRSEYSTIDGQFLGVGIRSAGTITVLTVTGRGGVPVSAATVVLNVTVTESQASGFITVYPCGIAPPLASNLNYGINTTVANAVIVKVGSGGTVCLFNSGPTQLVADVNGYLLN